MLRNNTPFTEAQRFKKAAEYPSNFDILANNTTKSIQ